MSAMSEMRYGTFKMSYLLIGERRLNRFWAIAVPVRVEYLLAEEVFLCTAASYLFRPLQQGEVIPVYLISETPNGIKAEEQTR